MLICDVLDYHLGHTESIEDLVCSKLHSMLSKSPNLGIYIGELLIVLDGEEENINKLKETFKTDLLKEEEKSDNYESDEENAPTRKQQIEKARSYKIQEKLLHRLHKDILTDDKHTESILVKNVVVLLEYLSEASPQMILRLLGNYVILLSLDNYCYRSLFIKMTANVIILVLNNTRSDSKLDNSTLENYYNTKIKLLGLIIQRLHDKVTYVRKECLMSLIKLAQQE